MLPSGFKRIRHYGLLAAASKGKRLSQARALLQMPQASPQAVEDAQAFMRRVAALEIDICAHCQTGRLRLVQMLAPLRSTVPETNRAMACRGPP